MATLRVPVASVLVKSRDEEWVVNTFTSSMYRRIEEIGHPVLEAALARKRTDVPTVVPGVG